MDVLGVIMDEMFMLIMIISMDGGMLFDLKGKEGVVYLMVFFMNEII